MKSGFSYGNSYEDPCFLLKFSVSFQVRATVVSKSSRPPWWAYVDPHPSGSPAWSLRGLCWQGLGTGVAPPLTSTPSLSQATLQACSPLLSGSCRQACRKQGCESHPDGVLWDFHEAPCSPVWSKWLVSPCYHQPTTRLRG